MLVSHADFLLLAAEREQIVGTYKIIELNSCDATVDTRDDLLCYLDGVDMLRV